MRLRLELIAVAGVVAGAGSPDRLAAQADAIGVEAVVARSILDRMPQDSATVFTADVGTVWLWTRIAGATGQTITHVWKYGSREWTVNLPINGSPWRTFSSKAIAPEWTGQWVAEVHAEDGRVLARRTFTVGSR
jgi:hypothetical protein